MGSLVRSSLSIFSIKLDLSDFTAGVLDAKPIAETAAGDGVVARVAVVMACLVTVAGFLEDVGFGDVVVACLVAFAGFSGQEVGTEIVGGDKDAIWRNDIVNWFFRKYKYIYM